jgi:hypothetical protein
VAAYCLVVWYNFESFFISIAPFIDHLFLSVDLFLTSFQGPLVSTTSIQYFHWRDSSRRHELGAKIFNITTLSINAIQHKWQSASKHSESSAIMLTVAIYLFLCLMSLYWVLLVSMSLCGLPLCCVSWSRVLKCLIMSKDLICIAFLKSISYLLDIQYLVDQNLEKNIFGTDPCMFINLNGRAHLYVALWHSA